MMITNYMSDSIVQKVYSKNLNILCNQTLNLYLQTHTTDTLLDRRNYLWRLLHKIYTVVEFYTTYNSNSISTFRDNSSVPSTIP